MAKKLEKLERRTQRALLLIMQQGAGSSCSRTGHHRQLTHAVLGKRGAQQPCWLNGCNLIVAFTPTIS